MCLVNLQKAPGQICTEDKHPEHPARAKQNQTMNMENITLLYKYVKHIPRTCYSQVPYCFCHCIIKCLGKDQFMPHRRNEHTRIQLATTTNILARERKINGKLFAFLHLRAYEPPTEPTKRHVFFFWWYFRIFISAYN